MAVTSTTTSDNHSNNHSNTHGGDTDGGVIKDFEVFDVEQQAVAEGHLRNTTIENISWRGVTVTVKDRETKLPKTILENVEGIVEAGLFLFLPLLFPFPIVLKILLFKKKEETIRAKKRKWY